MNKKKILRCFSVLLALSMLMAMLPAGAYAADAWDGSIDVSWYNTTDTSFTITTAAQLAGLAAIVNGTAEGIDKDSFAGKTITAHNAETQAIPPRYDALTLNLSYEDRADMWGRIDRRVDVMMEQGLVEEVRALLASGVPEKCTAMQAIGYKEMVEAVLHTGDYRAGAEEIKLRSRQYAKRQLTWFKRNTAAKQIVWGSDPNLSDALRRSTEFMEEFGI